MEGSQKCSSLTKSSTSKEVRTIDDNKTWSKTFLEDEEILRGLIEPSRDGLSFHCHLCNVDVKTHHTYKSSTWDGSGGHKFSGKHEMT